MWGTVRSRCFLGSMGLIGLRSVVLCGMICGMSSQGSGFGGMCIVAFVGISTWSISCLWSTSFSPTMGDFSAFIDDHRLLDPLLVGRSFTWPNNKDIASFSRLNLFLFSAKWANHFVNVRQMRLAWLCSDHFPMALDCGLLPSCSCPFRFELTWYKAEGFVDLI